MPYVSFFFGIIIRMFHNYHNPPHFHAEYQGQTAKFDLNGNLVKGNIRSRTAKSLIKKGQTTQTRANGKLETSAKARRDTQDRPARLVARRKNYMPVVIDARYVSDYKIHVTFNNGEERVADFSKWGLGRGVYKPLKDTNYFKKFFVDGWTISWPNGADIAPETLYEDGEPV